MSSEEIELFNIEIEQRTQKIRQNLHALGRHDWSLWALALTVIFSLIAFVIAFFLSAAPGPAERSDPFAMSRSVRSLVVLILVFSAYTLFQQIQLRKKREVVVELIETAAQQQMRAESSLRSAKLDPLTGLHNIRYAREQLSTQMARSNRSHTPLTILRLNLDDLQTMTDHYGHSMGELALKIFGKRLITAIRGSDVAVRFGGDEFVALLPECTPSNAQMVINRLSPLGFEFDGKQVILTFSSGIAAYREGETADQLLQRAENAIQVSSQKSSENQFHSVV